MKHYILLLSAAICLTASAQTNSITTTTPGGRTVTATAVSDYIIKVSNSASTPGTIPNDYASTVTLPGHASTEVITDGNYLVMTTPAGLRVRMNISNGALTLSCGAGTMLSDPGITGRDTDDVMLFPERPARFYGAGERGHKLDLSGDTLVMFNRQNYGYTGSDPRIKQMNITMPIVLSDNGYALLFDDHTRSELILGDPIQYVTERGGRPDYYYIAGPALDRLVELTTSLTGRQPLPPLWSLGYITSKYGYRTQDETEGTIDTLKQRGYPVDGIVLDLYWYGVEQDMGRLSWDPEQWPDPQAMLAKLKKKGVNTVIISQPYILRNGRGLDNYNELASKGMLVKNADGEPLEVKIWVGEGGMFDVANPDTRQWLSDRYRLLTDMGVGGWWGDLGEPEVHPDSAMHANGQTRDQYHNLYGNDWSKIISDLYAEHYPDRRLLTMMRGGTTGLQRYSVFPWSTDVSRSWGGLEPQIRIMLNSGLSGLGYMGHDVGGFAVEEGKEYQPELYMRWLELGTFSPMLRTHAQKFAEPYHYPQYEDAIIHYIKERYRWLPYNYTLAWENATKGYPLVRPLNFHDNDPSLANVGDEYLWGSEVLVAPVLTEGATSRDVVLPPGRWFDYNHPENVYSGRISAYPTPLEVLPLFVKAGAFIPQAEYLIENTSDYDPGRFTVKYYPLDGVESAYTMYDDDRISPASLQEGKYRLINFTGSQQGDKIHVGISSEGTYPGAPEQLNIRLAVRTNTHAPVNSMKATPDSASGSIEATLTDRAGAAGICVIDLTIEPGHSYSIDITL